MSRGWGFCSIFCNEQQSPQQIIWPKLWVFPRMRNSDLSLHRTDLFCFLSYVLLTRSPIIFYIYECILRNWGRWLARVTEIENIPQLNPDLSGFKTKVLFAFCTGMKDDASFSCQSYHEVRGKWWLSLLVIGFKAFSQNQINFGKHFTMFYLSSYRIYIPV